MTKKDISCNSHDASHLQLLWYFVALPSVLSSGPRQPFENFPCDSKLWLDAAGLVKKNTEFILRSAANELRFGEVFSSCDWAWTSNRVEIRQRGADFSERCIVNVSSLSELTCNESQKVTTFHVACIQLQYFLAVLHGIVPVHEFDLCLGSVVVCSHSRCNGNAPVIEGQNESRLLLMLTLMGKNVMARQIERASHLNKSKREIMGNSLGK